MSIPKNLLGLFNDSSTRVWSSQELRREYESIFGAINPRVFCNSIKRILKKGHIQRFKNRTAEGYLYTKENVQGLTSRFDSYLLPYDFANKSSLLSLLKTECLTAPSFSKNAELSLKELPLSKDYSLQYLNSEKIRQFLAKLVAFVMGDGYIPHQENKVVFCFFLKRDALSFRKDFLAVFPKYPCRVSKGDGCYNCTINRYPIVHSLSLLGAPIGNKVYQSFLVPEWIYHGPIGLKKVFLSVIIGNEGSKPGKKYRRIQFVLSKSETHVENLLKFLNQIKEMLTCFGISSTYTQFRKQVGRNYYGRFYIVGKENLKTFYTALEFSYASEKQSALVHLCENTFLI